MVKKFHFAWNDTYYANIKPRYNNRVNSTPLSRSDGERKGKRGKKFNPIPQKAKSPEGIQGVIKFHDQFCNVKLKKKSISWKSKEYRRGEGNFYIKIKYFVKKRKKKKEKELQKEKRKEAAKRATMELPRKLSLGRATTIP